MCAISVSEDNLLGWALCGPQGSTLSFSGLAPSPAEPSHHPQHFNYCYWQILIIWKKQTAFLSGMSSTLNILPTFQSPWLWAKQDSAPQSTTSVIREEDLGCSNQLKLAGSSPADATESLEVVWGAGWPTDWLPVSSGFWFGSWQ